MKKTNKKLAITGETVRQLTGNLRVVLGEQLRKVVGGVVTDPTADVTCPTTAGYPSCDGPSDNCGSAGCESDGCFSHRPGVSCRPGGC